MLGSAKPKPAKGTAKSETYQRKLGRLREKARRWQAEANAEQAMERKRRVTRFLLDGRRCRVCGTSLWLSHDNPFRVAHCHHIIYRSAGGPDEISNRVTLCVACHQAEHAHRLILRGDADHLTVEWRA